MSKLLVSTTISMVIGVLCKWWYLTTLTGLTIVVSLVMIVVRQIRITHHMKRWVRTYIAPEQTKERIN